MFNGKAIVDERSIAPQLGVRKSACYPPLVSVVLSLLARVAAAESERMKAEAALTLRFAPRFNPVALLMPGETRLSAVLRWLLDENETHGQGGVFRDRFIVDLLNDRPENWAGARIECEVATVDGRGRIDLLMLSHDGARCVVIENKPWAGWQADQLPRYLADQLVKRDEVRVHALIGTDDAAAALEQHWSTCSREPLPPTITASGFDAVAAWLDYCAMITMAENVRRFIHDLADYCRRFILSEPSMTEINETAELILAGGEQTLRAARAIAAAVPLAMTRDIAARANGTVEIVGNNPAVRVVLDGVAVSFVLFGTPSPWAGVTEKARTEQLRGAIVWGQPERLWPRWTYLRKAGEEGRALAEAVASEDGELIANLIPTFARVLVGSEPLTSTASSTLR